ncbi:MAG: hypothetical protein K0Q85_537, partial [Caproiciproducens sp.]|nr:hypothetical protein [Caproiciproducens sp.]
CASEGNSAELFSKNFPKELLDRAVSYECFGGEMNVENLHGFDKFVAKMATKATADKKLAPPKINDENIAKLIEKILN